MKPFRAFALILALVAAAGEADAQTCRVTGASGACPASTTATLTANTLLQLTLSAPSTAVPSPGVTEYDAGYATTGGPSAIVKANASWTLQISAAAATFTATNTDPSEPARANKPTTDLEWGLAAGGPFTGVTTSVATLTSGTPTAGTATPVFFRILLSYALDTPGNYDLPLLFTLVSP